MDSQMHQQKHPSSIADARSVTTLQRNFRGHRSDYRTLLSRTKTLKSGLSQPADGRADKVSIEPDQRVHRTNCDITRNKKENSGSLNDTTLPIFVTQKSIGRTISLQLAKHSDLNEVKAIIKEALGLNVATDSLKLSCEGRFLHQGFSMDMIRPNTTFSAEFCTLLGGVEQDHKMIDTTVNQDAQQEIE